MTEFTIAVALILHPTEDHVLIAQRRAGVHMGGRWEFPGGKINPGETASAAAVRETAEETGIDVTPVEEWPTVSFDYPDRRIVIHPVLCRALTVDARPVDNLQVIWAVRSSLTKYTFPPANASLLARLLAR